MTEITLKNEYGEYSVKVKQEGMTTMDLVENLVISVLLSAGYGEKTIRDAFDQQGVL